MSNQGEPRWRNDREARKAAVEPYTRIVASISEVLFRTDPIGINFEHNTDEYDPEAETILLRLLAHEQPLLAELVVEIVVDEFRRWFGDIYGADQYIPISAEIQLLFENRESTD